MIKHLKTFEWSTDFECTSCGAAFNVSDDSDAVVAPNKGHICETVPARPGLGTALEFTMLGDPPRHPADIARDAALKVQEELQRDRDWARFAEGRMGG